MKRNNIYMHLDEENIHFFHSKVSLFGSESKLLTSHLLVYVGQCPSITSHYQKISGCLLRAFSDLQVSVLPCRTD